MKEYFQYLIWMMLFIIVIEMFFPDSAYRKYIKLILGCILIYTMLSPLLKCIQVDGQGYENYVKKYQQLLGTQEGMERYEEIVIQQQESLKEIYKESIKAYVEQHFEVTVTQVSISWRGEELGSVNLCIQPQKKKEEIGTVHIGEKNNTLNGEEEQLKNKIKTCLSDFYNVQVDNIYITVQKN